MRNTDKAVPIQPQPQYHIDLDDPHVQALITLIAQVQLDHAKLMAQRRRMALKAVPSS